MSSSTDTLAHSIVQLSKGLQRKSINFYNSRRYTTAGTPVNTMCLYLMFEVQIQCLTTRLYQSTESGTNGSHICCNTYYIVGGFGLKLCTPPPPPPSTHKYTNIKIK